MPGKSPKIFIQNYASILSLHEGTLGTRHLKALNLEVQIHSSLKHLLFEDTNPSPERVLRCPYFVSLAAILLFFFLGSVIFYTNREDSY